jgi:hypothetical protein
VSQQPTGFPTSRDLLKWPFAADSIWNTSTGSGARYAPCDFDPLVVAAHGHAQADDVLIYTTGAPSTPVWQNASNVDQADDRRPVAAPETRLTTVNIPRNWVPDEPVRAGRTTQNTTWAAVRPDGRTIVYGSNIARRSPGGPITSRGPLRSSEPAARDGTDLFGPGRHGPHDGSRLGGFGGCIRMGELVGPADIYHAIRVTINQAYLYRDPAWRQETHPLYLTAYRWPAYHGDAWTSYSGSNPDLLMGALLAIPPRHNVDSFGATWDGTGHGPSGNLETAPGWKLARCLQNYGAYLHGTTKDDVWTWTLERGPRPDGSCQRAADEFRQMFGHSFAREHHPVDGMAEPRRWRTTPGAGGAHGAWIRDLDRCIARLAVITNNGPDTVGGGGTGRMPPAPPFA